MGGGVWGRCHTAGVGEVADRKEPGSSDHGRTTAPACRTGAYPLGQGRGKAPIGGPGLQCPRLNQFKPVK
jgi:hypothetical protein